MLNITRQDIDEQFSLLGKLFVVVAILKALYVHYNIQDKILNYQSVQEAKELLQMFKTEKKHSIIIENFDEGGSVV